MEVISIEHINKGTKRMAWNSNLYSTIAISKEPLGHTALNKSTEHTCITYLYVALKYVFYD